MNIYLDMFLTFARIGACTFGGGYAMLPILQREVVEKKGWATDEELTDYYAIGQCTPGIIAVNVATFIGHKFKGIAGGVAATLGVVLPSFIIIYLISLFFMNILDYPIIAHAFQGIKVCVGVLILKTGFKMFGKLKRSPINLVIFAAALIISLAVDIFALNFSSIYLIIFCGILGYVMWLVNHLREKKEEAK